MQQHLTMTNTPILQLLEYSYLTISGDKSIHFLQGQLSCDVNTLAAEQGKFSAYLNVQGRVISTIRLFHHHEHLLLQVPSNIVETVLNKLSRVAMLSRVTIKPMQNLQTIGILSSNPKEKLQSYFSFIPDLPMQTFHENNITLICIIPNQQYMLVGSADTLCNFKQETTSVQPLWLYYLIKERLVEVDALISEQFTPHEIDLPAHNAVSFTKGCYVGQEIVARMQYLGKLKQHLQLLSWTSPPVGCILDKLYNQEKKSVGQLAAIVTINNTQYALAVLRDDHQHAALFTSQNEQLVTN